MTSVSTSPLFKVVEIEINSQCNMSCSYCPNSIAQRVEKGEMSEELFVKILNSLVEVSYKGLISFHFYNEPLLSRNIIKYTKMLKEKLPQVTLQVYTNGTLLTLSKFRDLINAGVDAFKVTKHEDVRSDYTFDKTYSELSDSEKKRVIYLGYKELDLTNRSGILEHINNVVPSHTPCFLPSAMMVITVNGTVLPCYEDFAQNLAMGSILQHSLLSIWESSKFVEFRNKLKKPNGRMSNPHCEKCNNFNLPTLRK